MSETKSRLLHLRGKKFAWGQRTYLMGIINATPDSFSGDGLNCDAGAAVERAHRFAHAGCDIIDIGGESTRPGHTAVPDVEEQRRVLPVLKAVRAAVDMPLSVDTFKPSVAARALDAGADMINCIWGAVPGIVRAVALHAAPLVIMHNRPAADYAGDCVAEVTRWLRDACARAAAQGIASERMIADPGIGFGKTASHNIEILSRLKEIADALPYPLLVGTSRKSFIAKITGDAASERIFGTAATVALAIAAGADIVRIHDVAQMREVAAVADAISRSSRQASVMPA
ncbi:MAG: dihydropteroate synthase [Candidatus Eremiobacteraeota bacterium]|nr:dihydropteroate synthase [Candidatus Eremiobacteraeota bacterium]